MRPMLLLPAIALLHLAPAASAQTTGPLLVYPAMRHADGAYVVATGPGGGIQSCRNAQAGAPPSEAACAALVAKGVPATVTPAKAASDPAGWFPLGDFPDESARNAQGKSLELLFEVDEGGRISDCRTYASSGDAEVDRLACASMAARARFSPATYKGQAVPAVGIKALRFAGQ